jgi:hypothetical protein
MVCSPRSATWACPCCQSAASTQTVNPPGGSDATAPHPKASAPHPTVPAAPDTQATARTPAEPADRPADPLRPPACLLSQGTSS